MHKVRLYIACSWFNPEQVANMERAHALLKNTPSVDWEGSYRPVEHQWGGHVFGQDPEEDERWYNNRDWQAHTYYEDLLGLNRSERWGVYLVYPMAYLEEVLAIAELPAKEVLQAQVLGTMLAPITSLAIVLKAIAEEKGGFVEAEPAEAEAAPAE